MRLDPLLAACLTLVGLVASTSSHALTQSTVPNGYAATPGTSTFLGPFVNTGRTYQLLISESQMTAHLGAALSAISFRLPASATADWPASAVNFANYDIRLSASVAPASRSLTFADNIVGTQTLVRSGALAVAAGSFDSGSSPNAFGLSIDFDRGYQYNGGNLLIEIRHSGFTGTSQAIEAMLATGGAAQGYGTLFSAAAGATYAATSGTQANFAVVQIASVPVPEPASVLLFAAGVLALTVSTRQRTAHRG